MLADIRTTVRQLRKAPAHVAAVTLALAVGLAVCVAVFSAMNAVLFGDAAGMAHRADLIQVRWGDNNSPFSSVEWERAPHLFGDQFTSVAAEGTRRVAVGLPSGPVTLTTAFVSDRYFETLGTAPIVGRLLGPGDSVSGVPVAALVGARTWRESFGASSDVLGKTITVAGSSAVVVGVTPDRMTGLTLHESSSDDDQPQVWLPLVTASSVPGVPPSQDWLSIAGRLRPGATLPAVRAAAAVAGPLLAQDRLTAKGPTDRTLRAFRAGFDWRDTPVDALAVTAIFLFVPLGVLAIGCANVLNLQLSRAADRVRELRLRLALGASRIRIVRLLATEVLLLYSVASVVGWRGAVLLLRFAEPRFGRRIDIDASVLLFGLTLTFVVIAVAGVAPAWLATRGLSGGQSRQRGNEAVTFKKLRASLVVTQLTASMALLFVSALGIASLQAQVPTLPSVADQIVVAEFSLGDVHYSRAQAGGFVRDMVNELRGGTTAPTGFSDFLPFSGAVRYALPGDASAVNRIVAGGFVTPGWFDATDMRLLAGSLFTSGAEPVAVVNQAAAVAIAGRGQTAVGRIVRAAHADQRMRDVEIVGVVADSSIDAGNRPVPMMFLPMPAEPPTALFLSARGLHTAVAIVRIRTAVDSVDGSVPWVRIGTLASRQDVLFRGYREAVWLGGALGILSLCLAATGLFALMSYTVRRRTHEFGVRLAIGATSRNLANMVLGQGLALVVLGVSTGLIVAIPLGYVLRSVLVGTSPVDPFAISLVTIVFLAVGLVSAAVPAIRAARVDPMVALRQE